MRFLVNALVVTLVAADSACTAKDKTIMANDHFPGVLWQCSKDALVFPKLLIPPCLNKDCGLSKGCGKCFGDFGQCGLDCVHQCLETPSSDDCKTCMDKHGCNKALLKCTGLDKLFPAPTKKYTMRPLIADICPHTFYEGLFQRRDTFPLLRQQCCLTLSHLIMWRRIAMNIILWDMS
ncbi:hypothetical protein FOZ60_002357 [Perkinsus olseni]|uniref:Immunoglobulin super DCC subclass member n=2 Tax=Perkinsus olseni TaxID=32597 RepID=A0A7J6NY90_PEROL|nr:hypothetical protein FOZ60_002357 [Perkinsus olseni]